ISWTNCFQRSANSESGLRKGRPRMTRVAPQKRPPRAQPAAGGNEVSPLSIGAPDRIRPQKLSPDRALEQLRFQGGVFAGVLRSHPVPTTVDRLLPRVVLYALNRGAPSSDRLRASVSPI